jgi:hypothetical protein
MDWAAVLEKQGTRVVPLAASMLFNTVYLELKPTLPLYEFMASSIGVLTVASGVLFIVKWMFDWPKVPAAEK